MHSFLFFKCDYTSNFFAYYTLSKFACVINMTSVRMQSVVLGAAWFSKISI